MALLEVVPVGPRRCLVAHRRVNKAVVEAAAAQVCSGRVVGLGLLVAEVVPFFLHRAVQGAPGAEALRALVSQQQRQRQGSLLEGLGSSPQVARLAHWGQPVVLGRKRKQAGLHQAREAYLAHQNTSKQEEVPKVDCHSLQPVVLSATEDLESSSPVAPARPASVEASHCLQARTGLWPRSEQTGRSLHSNKLKSLPAVRRMEDLGPR